MGIYDNWDEFVKMAGENVGAAGTDLPPPATWRDVAACWLDFGWHFVQFIIIFALSAFDFVVWMNIIEFIYKL